MSKPDRPPVPAVVTDADFGLTRVIIWAKSHATPYHMMVASVLGTITAIFFTVIALLIMVALNFNILSLIE